MNISKIIDVESLITNDTLLAVDSSGSMPLNIITELNKSALKNVPTVLFDYEIRMVSLKLQYINQLSGFGGTNYQVAIDYAKLNGYKKIIIVSDGYAPPFCNHELEVIFILTEKNPKFLKDHPNMSYVLEVNND